MHKGPRPNDAKNPYVWLRPLQHFVWDYILSVECDALFPTYADISSPQRNIVSPLSENMHRTMAASVRPTRSDMPICCGVLVLAYSIGAVVLEVVAYELASCIRSQPLDANPT